MGISQLIGYHYIPTPMLVNPNPPDFHHLAKKKAPQLRRGGPRYARSFNPFDVLRVVVFLLPLLGDGIKLSLVFLVFFFLLNLGDFQRLAL